MKKLFLVILASFIFVSDYAQTTTTPAPSNEKNFRFGLKASPNFSWFKIEGKDFKSGGLKLGFSYGLMADFNFADNYAFAIELMMANTPGKVVVPNPQFTNGTPHEATYSYKLQYISLPLTLKMKTKEHNYLKFYGQFGLDPAFNIKARASVDQGPYPNTLFNVSDSAYAQNFVDDIKFFRAGLIIGGGVEYSLGGKTSLLCGVVFNNGFITDISKEPRLKMNANYIALNLGIFF